MGIEGAIDFRIEGMQRVRKEKDRKSEARNLQTVKWPEKGKGATGLSRGTVAGCPRRKSQENRGRSFSKR